MTAPPLDAFQKLDQECAELERTRLTAYHEYIRVNTAAERIRHTPAACKTVHDFRRHILREKLLLVDVKGRVPSREAPQPVGVGPLLRLLFGCPKMLIEMRYWVEEGMD